MYCVFNLNWYVTVAYRHNRGNMFSDTFIRERCFVSFNYD